MLRTRVFTAVAIGVVVTAALVPVGPAAANHPAPEMIKDLRDGPESSGPDRLTRIGDTVFFEANDGTHGYELWKTDGTGAGTTMVADINPTPASETDPAAGSEIAHLTEVGGTLFFSANDGVNGHELWKSDGTEGGTEMVADIHPTGESNLSALTAADGLVYFFADDGSNGRELWVSDGTEGGTSMVKDIRSGPESSFSESMIAIDGTLYFGASNGPNNHELWKSDGTEAGTVMVEDANPNGGTGVGWFADFNGTLFYAGHDGATGWELWKSDGTADGTQRVKDIAPGQMGGVHSLVVANDTLFFSAQVASAHQQLWRSDGTPDGTTMVAPVGPGALTAVGNDVFFSAWQESTGTELWTSDGTSAGTGLVKDLLEGPGNSFPYALTDVGGRLFFTVSEADGELWESDGTEEGTIFYDLNPAGPSNPGDFVRLGDSILFTATDADHGAELWGTEVPSYELTVSTKGQGSVASDVAGIDCGPDCEELYELETKVQLTATPAAGWLFKKWTGACNGKGTCVVAMDGARSVGATFVRQTKWWITGSGNYVGTRADDVFNIRLRDAPTRPVTINVDGLGGSDSFNLAFGFDSTNKPVKIELLGRRGKDTVKLPKRIPNGVSLSIALGGGADKVVRASSTTGSLALVQGGGSSTKLVSIGGGAGPDVVMGTIGDDSLTGGGGADILKGSAGDDHLKGGPGPDAVWGGEGNDVLNGGPGKDECGGGPGSNELRSC